MLTALILLFFEVFGERKCGGDIKEISKDGMASLHKAVHPMIRPDLVCVRELLEKGADVNLQTSQGSTSLHLLFKGASDVKLTASVLDLFLEEAVDLEIKDDNGFEAVHYLYENTKVPDEFKAEVVRKLVERGNHVSEEMPWLGIALPFLEKKLELLPGPPIPQAVKAVFEKENEVFSKIKIAECLADNAKQEEQLNEFQEKNKQLEGQLQVQLGNNEQLEKMALEKEETLARNAVEIERLHLAEAKLQADLQEQSGVLQESLRKLEKAESQESFRKREKADFQESLENEKAAATMLREELNSVKMQLEMKSAQACNETCVTKNETLAPSESPVDALELVAEVERLTLEKRQIIAFLIQCVAVYSCWKLGKRLFRKKEEPDVPSELTKYIEKLEKTLEYNRGLRGAMEYTLDRKEKKIEQLETSLQNLSGQLFDENTESDADQTTEDPSSLSIEAAYSRD